MKKNSQAFVKQMLVCLLVTFCFSGSIGLGMVWMRHQIKLLADANRVLEGRIVVVDRHLADTAAVIEAEQSYDVLRERNISLRLGLTKPKEILVPGDPVLHLMAKRN